jgi:hypothetical protein
MAYCAYITKIKDLRKHSNADRLQVGTCFGNNVIVSLETKEGQLGVYFPVDGKLGIEYATKNDLLRRKDENGNQCGGYLDPDKRNITAIKLRKEQSDGLFMPLSSLDDFCDISKLVEGDTIDVLNGVVICEKYIPQKKQRGEQTSSKGGKTSNKGVPKDKFPFFVEHTDTSQLAYNLGQFKEGDLCTITLKMHGTSARTAFTIKDEVQKKSLIDRILRKPFKTVNKWDYISGTRRVNLNFKSDDKGFYGDNEFRKKYHDMIAPRLHKGEAVFYEIVGYVSKDSTIMGTCSNAKVDKDFVKQYGETTTFSYGCENGENDIYVYRMTKTDEDGNVVEYPFHLVQLRCEYMGLKTVPVFDKFFYTTEEDLLARVNQFVDGADPIGKTHVREGVVVRIENRENFKAYKHKNFSFKVLEGIIKNEATEADMEEAQELIES